MQQAVAEANLPADHFLCCPDNIAAVKAMIRGDSTAVEAPKKWLYSIVCNERSGNLPFTPVCSAERGVCARSIYFYRCSMKRAKNSSFVFWGSCSTSAFRVTRTSTSK